MISLKEKEDLVIDLLNKNHAIREIAAKVHVSFDGKMVSLNKTRYSLSSVVRLNESLEK